MRFNPARVFPDGIALSEALPEAGAPVPELRWIHVATEGNYLGHHQGPFALTREVFATMVANLRADPRYKAAADAENPARAVGGSPILQFDYEHASEMPPDGGSIPESGVPAPAWVLDAEVRQGADGKAQLWAWARLGEKIRGQIQRGEYRFVSIAFNPEGVDWRSGASTGPTLTSIAFTNQPFLRDLQPLAARAASQTQLPDVQQGSPKAGESASARMEKNMEDLKNLAKILGIKALQTEPLAQLEEAAAEAAGNSADLSSILEALGVTGATDALAQIPALMQARDKLAATMAQLDEMLAFQSGIDEQIAETDVGAAMSARGVKDDATKRALKLYRAHLVEAEVKTLGDSATGKQRFDAKAAGRAKFLTEYGVPDADKAHLLKTFAAGGGGRQVEAPKSLPLKERADGSPERIELRSYPGRNTTEKLCSYIISKDPRAAQWPLETLITEASKLRRSAELA